MLNAHAFRRRRNATDGRATVAGLPAGDEGAWESLIKRCQRLIYAVPRRAGLGEDAAPEVFQEVFTTLLENLNSIEQPSRLHAWLVTTARRKTWRIRRASSLRPFNDEQDDCEDEMLNIADESILPDAALEQLEQQHSVRVALAELYERCRKLLTLLFYQAEPPLTPRSPSPSVPRKAASARPARAVCES